MVAGLLALPLLLAAFPGGMHVAEAASAAQEAALRAKLKSGYDPALPPAGDPVEVRMYVDIVHVELYESNDFMEIEGLVYLAWTDNRLSWEGSDITSVDVYTDEIWVPDLGVMHRWQVDPMGESLPRTRCVLSSGGHVECMPPMDFLSHCVQDVSRWPYSDHNCTMRLTSSLLSHQLKFELHGVFFVYELASRNWDHLDIASYTEESANRSTVVVSLFMRQHSKLQTAVFITPAFVLAGLSVSTWFLPAASSERLLLATISIFLHSNVIDSLAFALPDNGDKPPQVVLLYRDLLLVAAASFTAAVALGGLTALSAPSTSSWLRDLLASAPARLLLCAPQGSLRLQEEEDVEGLVSADEQAAAAPPPGAYLALLMDRLGLVVVTVTSVAALALRILA